VRTKVVVLKTATGSSRGSATGFLVAPGLVLTTDHAVKADARVLAWVNGVSYPADLLVSHPDYDLAVLGLRAPKLLLKPVELAADTRSLEADEPLLILAGPSQPANAHGDPDERVVKTAVYRGKVRLRLPNGSDGVMLKMETAVERGDSGSPVVRVRDGRVVGMLNSRELPDAAGVSHNAYAVPIEAAQPWLKEARERVERREDGDDFYLRRVSGK
jgi:S1-C subfamily serine protease